MNIVLQRVTSASVTVDGTVVGKIDKGLLVLLGISSEDTDADLAKYADKIMKLRIFADSDDKTNLSVKDINGSLLVVSQFTLCADCSHGNRPGFTGAMKPDEAERMYELFIELCKKEIPVVEHGIFGADMSVSLVNDGPFTIVLDDSIKKRGN